MRTVVYSIFPCLHAVFKRLTAVFINTWLLAATGGCRNTALSQEHAGHMTALFTGRVCGCGWV